MTKKIAAVAMTATYAAPGTIVSVNTVIKPKINPSAVAYMMLIGMAKCTFLEPTITAISATMNEIKMAVIKNSAETKVIAKKPLKIAIKINPNVLIVIPANVAEPASEYACERSILENTGFDERMFSPLI